MAEVACADVPLLPGVRSPDRLDAFRFQARRAIAAMDDLCPAPRPGGVRRPPAWIGTLRGSGALSAALAAMGLAPRPLPLDGGERRRVIEMLGQGVGFAFIDVTPSADADPTAPAAALAQLCELAPPGAARERIVVSRTGSGHLSPQERQWVRAMGFADAVGEWCVECSSGGLHDALVRVAAQTGLAVPDCGELMRHARRQDQVDSVPARAIVRGLTGLAAESLVERLSTALDVRDRTWRLHAYPHCFVGSEAVRWLMEGFDRPRHEAIAIGQALGALGLIVHVTYDHPFLDEHLFYRLAWSPTLDAVDLGAMWRALVSGASQLSALRRHLGAHYPAIFVGTQAVDLLAAQFALPRFEAWLALHRLAQWGLIRHVATARPFIDGDHYYRFDPGLPDASVP